MEEGRIDSPCFSGASGVVFPVKKTPQYFQSKPASSPLSWFCVDGNQVALWPEGWGHRHYQQELSKPSPCDGTVRADPLQA